MRQGRAEVEQRTMDLQSFRRYIVLTIGLGFVLCSGCATANRPATLPNPVVPLLKFKAHSEYYGPLKTFGEAYAQVKKNYVDEVSHPQLIPAAIKGIDKWLASQKKSYAKPALDSPASSRQETGALEWFIAAYVSLQRETEVEPRELGYAAINGMMKGLDPSCSLLRPDMYAEMQRETKSSFGAIGVQIDIRDGRLVVIAPIEGGPADRAGIQTGDVISKLNNEATQGLNLMEVVRHMRGPVGSKLIVTLERKERQEPLIIEFVREPIKIESVKARIVDGTIGYIRLIQFQESTPKKLEHTLQTFREQNIQALILDLRNNPGGLLTSAVGVAEQFLPQGRLIVTLQGRDGRKDQYVARNKQLFGDFPIVVLVNQGTVAGSEIVAAALQDWERALIIGTPTFGKGTVQTILPLSDGAGMRLTTARFYTPKGRLISETSKIQPDFLVEEKSGTDAPLSLAVETIKNK